MADCGDIAMLGVNSKWFNVKRDAGGIPFYIKQIQSEISCRRLCIAVAADLLLSLVR